MKYAVGIDVGGTNTRVALINEEYKILERIKFSTDSKDPEVTLQKIGEIIKGFAKEIEGIGISCPGPLDLIGGVVLTPPNLPGWHYLPLSKRLEEITGVKVALENDANLAALAEALVGAGAGKHFVQFLTISTGVGAGLCVNGKIYHGAKGFGQEVANSIVWRDGPSQGDLKKGSIESIASGTAITKRANDAGISAAHAGEVYEAAKAGNETAKEIMEDTYEYLSNFLGTLYGVLDPEIFILSGSVALKIPGFIKEVEKRTKVKARVVAHALENLIKESSKVMVMGHTNGDMDSIGSCMGIYRLAKTLGTNAYIVCSDDSPSIKSFRQEIDKDPEYEDVIINKDVAIENVDEDTLLVVVDTHKVNYVDSPELLEKVPKIVVIDHHRRSTNFIENATLMFQEVYASSAAELVTELLQYVEANVKLKTTEAESLYAGIMMDTKNFTFKTGVRTFEAAAYLRKCGVDIIRVKKWFQSDLASFNTIADIVKKAQIIESGIAISTYDEITKDASLTCAKAADELLTISNITASFVLGNTGEKICISGRSIGDINVQVILEKLGGGGHITLAGAQVEGMTMEETKQELINRINEYFSEVKS